MSQPGRNTSRLVVDGLWKEKAPPNSGWFWSNHWFRKQLVILVGLKVLLVIATKIHTVHDDMLIYIIYWFVLDWDRSPGYIGDAFTTFIGLKQKNTRRFILIPLNILTDVQYLFLVSPDVNSTDVGTTIINHHPLCFFFFKGGGVTSQLWIPGLNSPHKSKRQIKTIQPQLNE